MKMNYKKGFDVLLRSSSLWKDRTDEEKRGIFKTLNEEAGFNYELKSYQTNETLRNQIIDILKEETESISIEDVFGKIHFNHYTREEFNKEINRLLEDGFIFEPKKNKLRWLGMN